MSARRPRPLPRAAAALPLALLALVAAAAALSGAAVGARDLTVTVTGPGSAADNATVTVNITALNLGTGMGANVEVQLFVDGNATPSLHDLGNLGDGQAASASEAVVLACGVHTLRAAVDPSDGVPETDESNNNATLVVAVVPLATFTATRSGDLGAYSYTLDATASHGCSALNYTWSVGGAAHFGPVVSVTPPAGNTSVTLAVRAGSNPALVGHANETLTVPNAAPTVSLVLADDSIPTGWPLGLLIVADDADGSVAATAVDFGDGNQTADPVAAATYEYVRGGNFTVAVTVTDNLGATSSASVGVRVTNRPPNIQTSFPYWEAAAGTAIKFNASGSADPDGSPLTIAWNFGDGTTATGPVVEHAYSTPGTYLATVTATDEGGGTATETIQIRIAPQPSNNSWLFLVPLAAAAAVGVFLFMRKRQRAGAEAPADKPRSGAAPEGEEAPAGEGSSSEPPSP
jgi:PKD repeat protein